MLKLSLLSIKTPKYFKLSTQSIIVALKYLKGIIILLHLLKTINLVIFSFGDNLFIKNEEKAVKKCLL